VVYKIINIINNKIYIGYTKNSLKKRFRGHIKKSKTNSNRKLSNAIIKYGPENFKITKISESSSKQEALELEIKYIKNFNSFEKGYNMTEGGEGGSTTLNRTLSEEHKLKISKALKGLPKTEEHKKQLSINHADVNRELNPFYGKKHSVISKLKISSREYKKGKVHPNYGKPRKTSFKKGKEHPFSKQIIINNIEYESLREASRKLNINMYQIRKMYYEK
jgi:group I intron endonuclease